MPIVELGGERFFMDGYLKSNLDLLIKSVHKDRDALIIIDGPEREGKSTIASQMAKYVDPTYNVDRCCMNPVEFADKVKETNEKYKSIVLDEGMAFTGRGAMTTLNRNLIKVLSEIGMKNLFLFICIPSFHELEKYAAIHRSKALIHVYPVELNRGRFAFWNYSGKKQLYLQGKKFYSYTKPPANFFGRFAKAFPINKEEYNKKKLLAVNNMPNLDVTYKIKRLQAQRDCLIRWLIEKGEFQHKISERLKEKTDYPLSREGICLISGGQSS